MKGKELENFGTGVLKGLGFHVDHDLENAYKKDLDKNGKYEDDDQLEVDYLIPVGSLTLVGEITGEKSKSDSKEHVRTLSNSINVLRKGRKDEEFWRNLGVPDANIHHYLGTKRFLGFFVSNKHGKFEVDLPNVSGVVNFYKHDWETIKHYSKVIGQYGKRHFLEKLGVEERMGTEERIVVGKSNHLASYRYRHITGSVDSFAHVYRFEISPYDILSFSRVARRDDLPSMPESSEENYQRPLDETDVREIRDILRDKSNFIFPNNILCALSNECKYDEGENHLIIPKRYGAITVIDGQHRLYSYAEDELREELTDPLVSITAIGFDNATREEVNAYSAYTFLEINSSQSPVDPEFLDVISYDVLRKNDKDSIAAKIIKDVNELEDECLYGMFDSYRNGRGLMKIQTIKRSLRTITNPSKIESLENASSGDRLKLRQGYESLLERNIEELQDPDTLVESATYAFRRFFSTLHSNFYHDWPDPVKDKSQQSTSLSLARGIAGIVLLLRSNYIEEGRDWQDVESDFADLKQNLLSLRNISEDKYENGNVIILDSTTKPIPGSNTTRHDFCRFFIRNISSPTSIQDI